MDGRSSQYRIRQCIECTRDIEYACPTCNYDMCSRCKENHVFDLNTTDHNVVIYREKIKHLTEQEICIAHQNNLNILFRELCRSPQSELLSYISSFPFPINVCSQITHTVLYMLEDFRSRRKQHRSTIYTIRSTDIYHRSTLLTEIMADFKTCHRKFFHHQSRMLIKAKRLKNGIDNIVRDFDCKHRCLKQKIEIIKHITNMQKYEIIYEHKAISPVHFISSIKKIYLKKIHLAVHTRQLYVTESLQKNDVMESLNGIQIKSRGIRRIKNENALELLTSPEFHQSLYVANCICSWHISVVASDRAWVNHVLTDTNRKVLHTLGDISQESFMYGWHTTNNDGDLIYIDQKHNIKILSNDLRTTTTFMKGICASWKLRSLHWSRINGDLLVVMYQEKTEIGKVVRFSQTGKLTQTIQHDENGKKLFKGPRYITENHNGDVVLSDLNGGYFDEKAYDEDQSEHYANMKKYNPKGGFLGMNADNAVSAFYGAIVVTDLRGRRRFSYTGRSRGLKIWPGGICVDAMSHILACDGATESVHIIEKNGQFLSKILIRQPGIFTPVSIGYDDITHRLWVGSQGGKKVCIYRYIARRNTVTDLRAALGDLSSKTSENKFNDEEVEQKEDKSLLTFSSFLKFLQSYPVQHVTGFHHICCLSSQQVWISDNKNNIFLLDYRNVKPIHLDCMIRSHLNGYALHTVNSDGELIFVDSNHTIVKLSVDMKLLPLVNHTTDNTWDPICVHWSPVTEDLLVGMCSKLNDAAKVTRYNKTGKLIHTIQHNKTGQDLYRSPQYISENSNGDVIVSDNDFGFGAVVVTDRDRQLRFTYTGHPPGSGLWPRGICTDLLSNILVCDVLNYSIHLIDKNGQFLKRLLTKSYKLRKPWILNYDFKANLLLVGSRYSNKVYVFRYIIEGNTVAGLKAASRELSSKTSKKKPIELELD